MKWWTQSVELFSDWTIWSNKGIQLQYNLYELLKISNEISIYVNYYDANWSYYDSLLYIVETFDDYDLILRVIIEYTSRHIFRYVHPIAERPKTKEPPSEKQFHPQMKQCQ